MIKRSLTGSRIDNMYALYKIIIEEFNNQQTDEIDKDKLFKIIMQKGKGSLDPSIVKEELNKIFKEQ